MSLQLQLELTQKFPESSQPSLHSQSLKCPIFGNQPLGSPWAQGGDKQGAMVSRRPPPPQKHSWPSLVGWGGAGDRVGAAGSGEDRQGLPTTTPLKFKNGTSMSSADHRTAGLPAAALPCPVLPLTRQTSPCPVGLGHPWVWSCRAEPPWGHPGQPGHLPCGGLQPLLGPQESPLHSGRQHPHCSSPTIPSNRHTQAGLPSTGFIEGTG